MFSDEEIESACGTAPNAHSLGAFVEGLKLLGIKDEDKFFMGAEHDIVYAYYIEEDEPHPNGETAYRLSCLGFHWDAGASCWAWYV